MNVATDPWVGALLSGRYRVVRALGRGGAGAVYEAEQIGLDRKVAIKLMRPELAADLEQLERFRREARAAAQLGHPHIVQLFDFAEARDGEPAYLVLELVSGPSLYQLLRAEAPLAPERAVHLATQILAALGAAHAAGIVHRDIKPGNVVVAQVPGVGEVAKVLDFGIARMQESETYQRLTRTGVIIGTPRYMSPEQATGTPLDGRADLWALGVVLYASLTGRFPFEGTPSDVVTAILSAPVPPMARDDLPPMLESAVRRALEKKREDRYESAEAMAHALRNALVADTLLTTRSERAPRLPETHVEPPRVMLPAEPHAPVIGAETATRTSPRGDAFPGAPTHVPASAPARPMPNVLRWIAALGALATIGVVALVVTLLALWASDVSVPALPTLSTPLGSGEPATWDVHRAEATRRALEADPTAELAAIGGMGVVLSEGSTFGTARAWAYTFITASGRVFSVSWGYGDEWMLTEGFPGIVPLEGEIPDSPALVAAALRDCPGFSSSELGGVSLGGMPSMGSYATLTVGSTVWSATMRADGSFVSNVLMCH